MVKYTPKDVMELQLVRKRFSCDSLAFLKITHGKNKHVQVFVISSSRIFV